ncbi:MAG: winged helix-turn-helix domain-containing protein [Rothia sp. (in: high G+C Gram-positive bacteria)]|uniref:winged helix-turn-helix domain-containing protein n=1 Tax=Rothia sp. (in: high G+C Gram-positive bacteria) TaxID=1885016 RepID=UPI0026DEF67D|nr:winged helix-turn-helix domain-containing protein [Rothia sp. (in: high G+C Gram-positive bacteria)]MDO5749769.1 winged helix-turn-helix domain-containing protein [Rothia sp. (in: high G+C Gram-positive bacteria)]
MSGAPGYVHISQRGRAAKRPATPTGNAPAATLRPMSFSTQEHGGTPENEARGFVLYVGLNEELAAANGTSLVRIVQDLRTYAHHLAPEAESYAAVALAPVNAEGTDLEVVRNALGDPTAIYYPGAEPEPETPSPTSSGVLIDLARREVFLDGEPLLLTFKEFELLAHLVENSSRTVGRDELLDALWRTDDEHHPHERTIDVHVRRLRSKLGRLSGTVRTVRGQGYRFFEHPEVVVWAAPEYLI